MPNILKYPSGCFAAASHCSAQTLKRRCCPFFPGDHVTVEEAREPVTALLCILDRLFRNNVTFFLPIMTKKFTYGQSL